MFAQATREKDRFELGVGVTYVQDLWDYEPEQLAVVAVALRAKLKKSGEDDFLRTKTPKDKSTKRKLEVVKYIIDTKLDERDARVDLEAKKQEKQVLLKALAKKQEETVDALSETELLAKLDKLG
ncbi:MAG: hypothetical protein DRQ44_18560 [Gammaproteobacteria bacterium]|nr:MAG: hypothetical protein DRQ44_18560 [Gammaproteobacteria bacterium]